MFICSTVKFVTFYNLKIKFNAHRISHLTYCILIKYKRFKADFLFLM